MCRLNPRSCLHDTYWNRFGDPQEEELLLTCEFSEYRNLA